MRFSEGDQVLARQPSGQEFEKAKIVTARGGRYKVLFKGGVEYTLAEGDVRAQRNSRSQTRPRGRPISKSPARASPGRKSPGRRSPGRSPARSPAVAKKPSTGRGPGRQPKISLSRLEMPKDNSSDTDVTESSESVREDQETRSSRGAARRSIRLASTAAKAETEQKLMMLRGADRAASLPSEKKERGSSAHRDEDLNKSKEVDFNKPQEWGGWFGALLLTLALPIGAVLLQIACFQDHCGTKYFRLPRYKEWRVLLNLDAYLIYAGYLVVVTILSVLPVGRVVDGQQTKLGRLQYRANGIWILLLALITFGGLTYQGYNVTDLLLKKSLQLTIAGVTYGTLIALALYIKGGKVPTSNLNIYASSNNPLYNFWQGREINPRFGPVDVKLVLFRAGLIATILVNAAAITKSIRAAPNLDLGHLNLAAIIVALLQNIYLLDSFVFESTLLTTFEFSYEGVGYMLSVGYLIYPYLATLTTRYLLIERTQTPLLLLGVCVVVFFVGLAIYRKSNSQKDEFRKNPFSPSVAHLETIPTKRGKRLIVSGLWGHVRHPNYLGDILMHLALAAASYSSDLLTYLLALEVTLSLVHRARRDNDRCEKRYGYAWRQYCARVKYMIVNRVY